MFPCIDSPFIMYYYAVSNQFLKQMEFFSIFPLPVIALLVGMISVLFSVYLFRRKRNLWFSTLFSSFAIVTTAFAYLYSSNITEIYKYTSLGLAIAAFSVSLIRTHHTDRKIHVILLMAFMFGVAAALVGIHAILPIVSTGNYTGVPIIWTQAITAACCFLSCSILSTAIIYAAYKIPNRFSDKEAKVYHMLSIVSVVVLSIAQIILVYLKL